MLGLSKTPVQDELLGLDGALTVDHPLSTVRRACRDSITPSKSLGDREQAQEALRKSEERWRAVFENSAIGVALTDHKGHFLATNPVYQKMLGYTDEELRKLSFLDVTHEDYRESNWTLVAELLEGKRKQCQVEKQYRRKDGGLIWVSNNVSVVPGTERVPRFIMALSEDISERKQAQEALRQSEDFKRRLIACSRDCIKVLDLEGRLLSMNESGMQQLEICGLAAFLNSSWFDFWEGEDREAARTAVESARNGGTGRFTGYFTTRITKTPRWWDVVVSPIPEAGGKPERLLAVSRDVTERKQAQEALQKSEERSRTLLEINNAIITCLTEETLLRSISRALRPVVPFDTAAITLYVPEIDKFRFLAVEGTLVYFHVGREIEHKDTSVGWVFDHQRPMVSRDLEKEKRYSNEMQLVAESMRSHCVVPLITRGNSIGTLNVGSRTSHQYSEHDAELLQEVANQVALAVENMKAYEEIRSLKTRLEAENVYLQEELLKEHNFNEIVGNSPALLEVLQKVEMAAPTDATVLLHGETGTGKEVIARAIHSRSARKARAMVTVNCGAIPAGLVESELFGHVKGAFTGALHNVHGRFELADGSTLFLDEVGELPAETQIKLLRVLQEREFQVVGSSKTTRVDVRIIAATNRNLQEDVRAGRFRSDLFYRLNVLPLEVPPLRERRSDIPQLVLFFLERSCQKFGKKIEAVSQDTMEQLMSYDWPGNVRELQNIVERGVVLSNRSVLTLDQGLFPVAQHKATSVASEPISEPAAITPDPGAPSGKPPKEAPSPPRPLEEVERDHIVAALGHTLGIIDGPRGAAKFLELHPSTLRARMKKLGIERLRH
jgi:formate hydrogenlyase transcriptional activator